MAERDSLPRLKTSARVAWLRFLDRVKPRRGVGGRPSPRIEEASPAMAARMEEILANRSLPDPAKRTLRCGPWTEREDGSMVCEKCGDVETRGGGPFGF